ncbi:MAG: hypothetical protein IK075_06510 [Prevotella sp.]|nr:hypothetical protein [Prevotella sp.]
MIDNNEKHGHSSQNLKIAFPFHYSNYFHAKVEKKSDTPKYFIIFILAFHSFFRNFASMKEKIVITILAVIGLASCHNHYEHKTVICIPVYGQSLALGVDAELITDFDSLANYANGRIVTENMNHRYGYYDTDEMKLFIKKLLHHQKHSYELSVYSMARWLTDNIGEDTLICIFPGGQDGTIISELGKDSEPYKKLLHDIETAYQLAKDRGWGFEMPALCWMQGETNVNSYPEDHYKELLLQFVNNINKDVKQITRQKRDVEIICYQTNSLTRAKYFQPLTYNCRETEVAQTQLELIRGNPIFHASGPTYPYDCVDEIIHIDGLGQMKHGILAALAAQDIIRHQKNKRGLIPTKIECLDKEVIVRFSIPHPPLVIDTIQVAKARNYGFSVITPNNCDIATNAYLQDNLIHILCSESPKDCRIRYAVNGEYMKSGRLHGPRGNLRDSQGDSLVLTVHGKEYPIHNWCFQFDMPL